MAYNEYRWNRYHNTEGTMTDSTHVQTLSKLLMKERAKLRRQLAAVGATEFELDMLGDAAPAAVFNRLQTKLERQRNNMDVTMRYVETIESELRKISKEESIDEMNKTNINADEPRKPDTKKK